MPPEDVPVSDFVDGEMPPDLNPLLEEGYIDDASVFDSLNPGQGLIYRRLPAGADGKEIIAYYWPPTARGRAAMTCSAWSTKPKFSSSPARMSMDSGLSRCTK